jgi:dienelactone hydrolase
MKYNFLINSKSGNRIELDLYTESQFEARPAVVLVHGFKGFKDWGFFPTAAEYFARMGFHAFVLNFSHNGITSGTDIFNELEKFAKNTLSLEIDELKEVSSFIISSEFCNFSGKLFIIGHSRGGGDVLLASPDIKNLVATSVWASIAFVDRYTEHQKNEWKQKGYIEFLNARTGQKMRLNYSYLDDVLANKEGALSIEKAIRRTSVPILAVHGEVDLTVSFKESEQIISFSKNEESEIFIIPQTGHTFNMVHPSKGLTSQFESVLSKTEKFFRKYI